MDTIKTEMVRGFNKNFQDKMRQLFADHELEQTSSIDRIISSYQNQSAILEKELLSKCDELKRRQMEMVEAVTIELSQVASECTPPHPIKTEFMEYECKQECL